jgi:hypothetical protein
MNPLATRHSDECSAAVKSDLVGILSIDGLRLVSDSQFFIRNQTGGYRYPRPASHDAFTMSMMTPVSMRASRKLSP